MASAPPPGCDFGCFDIFEPVCASNGETFGNACEFNRTRCISGDDTLKIVSRGPCHSAHEPGSPCLQEFTCLDVYTPVCGSDGQTYSNECFLRRAQCSDSTLTILSDGECNANNSTAAEASSGDRNISSSTTDAGICIENLCTKEFHPLCGSDGVTYYNKCLFRNAQCRNSSLIFAFDGECSSESKASISGPVVGSGTAISQESTSAETNSAGTSHKSFLLFPVVAVLLVILTLKC